jgi:hypothetical protein
MTSSDGSERFLSNAGKVPSSIARIYHNGVMGLEPTKCYQY